MTYRLQIIWKVFSDLLPSTSLDSLESAPSIFQIRTSKSLLREIGSSVKDTIVPSTLEPTHVFYNALRKELARNKIDGKKFPFIFPIVLNSSGAAQVRVNLVIHRYGRVVCVSVETQCFDVPEDADLTQIKQLQYHKELFAVVRHVISIIKQGSRNPRPDGAGVVVLPCVQIIAADASCDLSDQSLAGLVTGHPEVNPNVIEDLLARNRAHQIDNTSLLCEKQGIVFYAPSRTSGAVVAGMSRRFRSASGMLEVAQAVQMMLRGTGECSLTDLLAIQQLVEESDLVFADSVSGRKLWDLFSSEFKLKNFLSRKKEKMQTANSTPTIKVLCIAAAPVELTSITKFFDEKLGKAKTYKFGSGRDFDPANGYFDKESNVQWYIASQDAQGIESASSDVGRLAQRIQPDHVVMVGMCMALPHSQLAPGTVVIPHGLFSVEHQRETVGGTEYRPRGMEGQSGLERLAKLTSNDGFDFKVVFGKKLASASVKIENPDAAIVEYLHQFAKDVVAFDMEGWGFYKGAADFSCLWIKAVADAGEPQAAAGEGRDKKQTVQSDVTKNAAAFAFSLIKKMAEVESHS